MTLSSQAPANILAVGSANPAKIEAVSQAFHRVFPRINWAIEPIEVDSGVSPQPLTDTEAIIGAKNRAIQAQQKVSATYHIGLEGGLSHIAGTWFASGWAVVVDHTGRMGVGASAKVEVPAPIMVHIHRGRELGQAIDLFFDTTDARLSTGHFGLMTRNHITRISGYADGVIMALAKFLHPGKFS